jgi:hypothetical protein
MECEYSLRKHFQKNPVFTLGFCGNAQSLSANSQTSLAYLEKNVHELSKGFISKPNAPEG